MAVMALVGFTLLGVAGSLSAIKRSFDHLHGSIFS
jgi:uncharacterized membrane protein YeiH